MLNIATSGALGPSFVIDLAATDKELECGALMLFLFRPVVFVVPLSVVVAVRRQFCLFCQIAFEVHMPQIFDGADDHPHWDQ